MRSEAEREHVDSSQLSKRHAETTKVSSHSDLQWVNRRLQFIILTRMDTESNGAW